MTTVCFKTHPGLDVIWLESKGAVRRNGRLPISQESVNINVAIPADVVTVTASAATVIGPIRRPVRCLKVLRKETIDR